MGSLASLYIKKETLKTLLDVLEKKTGKESNGIEMTISINDDSNDYGQNLSAYISQTNEQRDAKKPRFFTGNGKVFWTDGKISVGIKKDAQSTQHAALAGNALSEDDDLSF